MSEQLQLEDEEVSITLRRAWDQSLRLVAGRVNKPTFETHIRAIRPISLTELQPGTNDRSVEILLGVPSAFTREWVEKRHSTMICEVLEEVLDRCVRIRFVLAPRDSALMASVEKQADEVPSASVTTKRPGTQMATMPLSSGDDESTETSRSTELASSTNEGPNDDTPEAANSPKTSKRKAAVTSSSASADSSALNPRYTFENFIVGPSNRLAQAGAQAVAESSGKIYNPLFIYGPSGLGKTHLMHAIGNEIQQHKNSARVAYMSGEMFTSGYITSLREHKAEEFRRRWRTVDVWLVDDIQFIAGKEHTKEEFFHTFNALYEGGKQIVISSDRSPKELRTMDERLRSRFESGLIADIAPPDLETRLAILYRKAEIERMRIPDEVLLYMARLVRSNIRTLEGALVKLIASASLTNTPVTIGLATSVLERYYFTASSSSDLASGERSTGQKGAFNGDSDSEGEALRTFAASAGLGISSAITPELVQKIVARKFGMTTESLSGKKRDRDVVAARQIAMHLTRELTQMSMPRIGRIFGGRDHTTVAYSCDKIKNQLSIDENLRQVVEDLTVQLRAQAQ